MMTAKSYVSWLRQNKRDSMSSGAAIKHLEEIMLNTDELIFFNFPLIKGDWKRTMHFRDLEDVTLEFTNIHTITVTFV